MNEQNESEEATPPIISAGPVSIENSPPVRSRPFGDYVRHFFACNPFYLVSAALLLFGLYRLADDSMFPGREVAQLAFNFTSLQFYEVLLVVTAVFLARRRIWYDSNLLVGLENLLLFVPFILISQAALIDIHAVWKLCAAGAYVAMLRSLGLKRFHVQLNLPARALIIGAVLLAVNFALPIVYRVLHESKFGTKPDWGAAYNTNRIAWLLILPAALAMANFLPHARETGSLLSQRRWLPGGMFALWIAGTVVHLYCLGYVYDFDLRPELVAPGLWVLVWTAWRRGADLLALPERFKTPLLGLPVAVALLAAGQHRNLVFLSLAALNLAAFGSMYFVHPNRRWIRHLVFTSFVMLVAGAPATWLQRIHPGFDRGNCIMAGLAMYGLLCTLISRDPKVAVLGAVVVSCGTGFILGDARGAIHWALQSGLIFFLLHSLGWKDAEHEGAAAVRRLACVASLLHAGLWLHTGGAPWMTCATGGALLAGYVTIQFFRGRRDHFILPATSLLLLVSGPGDAFFAVLRGTSGGLLAVIGSFLLFAFGTIAALTKHRWHSSRNSTHLNPP
jgi:hypothetical protein